MSSSANVNSQGYCVPSQKAGVFVLKLPGIQRLLCSQKAGVKCSY